MSDLDRGFYQAVLTAGAILAGFCGTFLVFRIEREANYYRTLGKHFNEQHLTSSLLVLIISAVSAFFFGVGWPLVVLSKNSAGQGSRMWITGGLIFALMTLGVYVLDELVHYRILIPSYERKRKRTRRLRRIIVPSGRSLRRIVRIDSFGFRRERPIWIAGLIVALIAGTIIFIYVRASYSTSNNGPSTIPRSTWRFEAGR
jgi:hypothetical protein